MSPIKDVPDHPPRSIGLRLKRILPVFLMLSVISISLIGFLGIDLEASPTLDPQAMAEIGQEPMIEANLSNWGTTGVSAKLAQDPEEGVVIGEACGGGTLLSETTICIHGAIFDVAGGDVTPLDQIEVEISYAGRSVTGTTFVHAGQVTPTYGIDISLIEPAYLQPISLEANVNGQTIGRSVTLYPDFRTMSQRVDLYMEETAAFAPVLLWGTVVDFGQEGALAGAVVTASYGSPSVDVTTTTAAMGSDPTPIFQFTAANLPGITPSASVTLSTRIDDDLEIRLITLEEDQPTQANLVTNWKCDDFDPFPRFGKGAFPRFGKGAFPNIACIHGIALLNGVPRQEIGIEIEVNGEIYAGATGLPSGEQIPRYGIAILGGDEVDGQAMTVTASYNGLSTSWFSDTVALDERGGLEVNLNILDTAALNDIVGPNELVDARFVGNSFWVGTTGGLLHYQTSPEPRLIKRYTTANSNLAHDNIFWVQIDHLDRVWVTTRELRSFQVYDPATDIWTDVDPRQNELDQHVVVSTTQQIWYFANGGENFRLDPASGRWEDTGEVEARQFIDRATDDQGRTWFADESRGIYVYDQNSDSWQNFNTTNSDIADDAFNGLMVAPNQAIWAASRNGGLIRYQPDINSWTAWGEADVPEISSDTIETVYVDEGGDVYVAMSEGIAVYTPSTDSWRTLDLSNTQFGGDQVEGAGVDGSGNLWVNYSRYGLAHVTPAGEWTPMILVDAGPIGAEVYGVKEASDGTVWYSSETGLSVFNPLNRTWVGYNATNSTLAPEIRFQDVDFLPGNRVISGHSSGVSILDRNAETWTHFENATNGDDTWSLTLTEAVVYDEVRNGVWIGSFFGLNFFDLEDESWTLSVPSTINTDFMDILGVELGPDGSVWVGTRTLGFLRFDPINNAWTSYSTASNIPEIPSDWAQAFAFNDNGDVWIGFAANGGSNGLVRFQPNLPNDEAWTLFNSQNSGLGNDSVTGLVMDQFDRLWIATYNGMFSLDTLEMKWESYTIEEGVGNGIFNGIEFGNDNDLWVPGANGVVHWYMPIEEADISVKIDGPSKVIGQSNAQLDYTLTISNIGNSAGEVIFSVERPPTLTLQSLSPTPAVIEGERYSLGIMAAGESQTFSLSLVGDLSAFIGSDHVLAVTGSAGSRETIVANNRAALSTRIVAPDRADVAVSLSGPPVLVSNQTVIYEMIAENLGALDAAGSQLTLELPPELDFVSADPAPTTLTPLTWNLGTLDSREGALPQLIKVTAESGDLSGGLERLTATADVSTATIEDITSNNSAIADLPVSGLDAETIFLVAPQRLAEQYGTSQVMERLYELSQHAAVNGLVLNIESDPLIRARFAAWDSSVKDWRAANALATDIQALLSTYTATYPNLKSVVIVGGDRVIPHYRLPDRNPTMWQERSYAAQVGNLSSIYYAMSANLLLTDDFYGTPSPVIPSSVFWPDQAPFYLPDVALGRLVETPDEIMATIDLFIERDGVYPYSQALIGGDEELAADLVDVECTIMQSLGYVTTCTTNEAAFRDAVTNQPDLIWTAWHSNHYGMGLFGDALTINDVARYAAEGTLNATIGCHAGLNVPDNGSLFDADLTQTFASKGGITIGSTGYTYGSFSELGYTELLYQGVLEQLSSGPVTVGDAVLDAKRQYYASRGWFDTLDEKTLATVTTFGLPMSRVDLSSPSSALKTASIESRDLLQDGELSLNLTLDDYEMVNTPEGTYFTYLDQTQSQHQLPIQPAQRQEIPAKQDGKILKDFVLRSATYAQIDPFDPLIDESWAMGAPLNRVSEPLINFSGWDREMPVNLNIASGSLEQNTYIDFTLGRYHADDQVEQLILELEIDLVYGDQADLIPPVISAVGIFTTADGPIQIEVEAVDESGIHAVVVLYELENGRWSSVDLTQSGSGWLGTMPTATARYLIQVVDQAQNVSRTDWSSDFSEAPPLQSTPTPQPTATLPPPTIGPSPTPTIGSTPIATPGKSSIDLFLPFILSQDRLVTSYDTNGR